MKIRSPFDLSVYFIQKYPTARHQSAASTTVSCQNKAGYFPKGNVPSLGGGFWGS